MIGKLLSRSYIKHQFDKGIYRSSQFIQKETLNVFYSQDDKIKIIIDIENRKTIYMLDKDQTFKQFRDSLQTDFPLQNIRINLNNNDENMQIYSFLQDKTCHQQIEIQTDEKSMYLQNTSENEIYKNIGISINDNFYMSELLKSLGESQNQNNGPLIFLIHNLKSKLKQQDGPLTIDQLQSIYIDCLRNHSIDQAELVVELNQKISAIEKEIEHLESQKNEILEKAQKVIILYMKLLVLFSILQIVIFYYCVFHVEWLGWDIMEPLTYSVGSISVVLMIRYFLRHKKNRDWTNLRNLYISKIINRKSITRDRFNFINNQLEDQQRQKDKLDLQLWLKLNKITNENTIE